MFINPIWMPPVNQRGGFKTFYITKAVDIILNLIFTNSSLYFFTLCGVQKHWPVYHLSIETYIL